MIDIRDGGKMTLDSGIEMIFCAAKNKQYARIAIAAGFRYGAQLPNRVYFEPYFVDQDWKRPDQDAYIRALSQHHPFMASVLDWEYSQQLSEVLSWAEDAAPFVETIMLIPKVHHSIQQLPRAIDGKPIRLGFSVPTRYGGTEVFLSEFAGWPVHLLGGSPGAQMWYAQYLDVKSIDGNMHMLMANRGLFWTRGRGRYSNHWTSILHQDGKRWNGNGNVEAFRRSCENIKIYWQTGGKKDGKAIDDLPLFAKDVS